MLPSITSISSVATVQTISSSAALAKNEPKDGRENPLSAEIGAEPSASAATRAMDIIRLNLVCFDIEVFSFVFIVFGFRSPFYNL